MSQDVRFIDKENNLKNLKSKSENTKRQHISRVPLGAKPGAKQAPRIPLGGKDENKQIPTLSRSQTTVDRVELVAKRVPLQSKPKFSKSNSSLGFYHNTALKPQVQISKQIQQPVKNNDIYKVGPHDKLSHNTNTIFNPELANRPPELEQFSLDTDSLKKKILHPKSDNVTNLKNTITKQTNQLSAQNVPNRQIHDLDPVKKSVVNNKLDQYLQDPERARLFEQLVEDEDSVETKHPVTISEESESSFTDEILGIFNNNSKPLTSPSDVHIQLDEISLGDDTFDMEQRVWDGKEDEHIGLSEQDLDELLDF